MSRIADFFADLDRQWRAAPSTPVPLRLIGSTALMLQTRYERGTKDSDILETGELTAEVRASLLAVAGPGTPLHTRHRMYLEFVLGGIPFLPQRPTWHRVDVPGLALRHLEVHALDIVDVVVSKLKRFSASDLGDIAAMIERGHVAHGDLVARFLAAVDMFAYDARGDDLPGVIDNLHRVERDLLGVDETSIALPSWI